MKNNNNNNNKSDKERAKDARQLLTQVVRDSKECDAKIMDSIVELDYCDDYEAELLRAYLIDDYQAYRNAWKSIENKLTRP